MRSILASLETIVNETDTNCSVLDIMMTNTEVTEAEKAYKEAVINEERVTDSINTLEHIKNMIEKHGISRPMMEMADPIGELAEAGIVPAYENLEDTPVHDSDVVASLESVQIIRNIVLSIINAIKSLCKRLKELFDKIVGFFTKKSSSSSKRTKTFKETTKNKKLNKSKADKVEIEVFKTIDVKTVIEQARIITKAVEAMAKNATLIDSGTIGFYNNLSTTVIKVDMTENELKLSTTGNKKTYYIGSMSLVIKPVKVKLSKAGLEGVEKFSEAASDFYVESVKSTSSLNSDVKSIDSQLKKMEKDISKVNDGADKDKMLLKAHALKNALKSCNTVVKFLKDTSSSIEKLAGIATSEAVKNSD